MARKRHRYGSGRSLRGALLFGTVLTALSIMMASGVFTSKPTLPETYGRHLPTYSVMPTVDASAPAEEVVSSRIRYQAYVASDPSFKCPDGRNDGLDHNDLKKFVPCPNGMFHFMLANGKVRVKAATKPWPLVRYANDGPVLPVKKGVKLWVFSQSDRGGAHKKLQYEFAPGIVPFGFFWKEGEEWLWVEALDEQRLQLEGEYQIVMLWHDPAKKYADVNIPFSWRSVNLPFIGD